MKVSGASERILDASIRLLTEWENSGSTLDDCLDELRRDDVPERAAVASLLFEYFRHKGFIDSIIAKHAKKDSIRQPMRLLLDCVITQIFFQSGLAWQSAANIAVDHAKLSGGRPAGNFINAMIRSILRDPASEREKLPDSVFPEKLCTRWVKQFGEEEAARIISCYALNPDLSFRSRRELTAEELASLSAQPLPDPGFSHPFRFFVTTDPASVFASGLIEKGVIYVQDPATASGLALLPAPPEGRVLDACAAPGGKTIMLYDLAVAPLQLKLTASDRSSKRLFLMNQNLRRAGVRCRTLVSDACSMPFSPGTFQLVLADVPCSNSGVIRRRPDAPWRFSENRLKELCALQKNILASLEKLVRPGGALLYSTCSIEAEEDSLQVKAFLETHPDFSLDAERLLTPAQDHDGAYAALLRRKA